MANGNGKVTVGHLALALSVIVNIVIAAVAVTQVREQTNALAEIVQDVKDEQKLLRASQGDLEIRLAVLEALNRNFQPQNQLPQ